MDKTNFEILFTHRDSHKIIDDQKPRTFLRLILISKNLRYLWIHIYLNKRFDVSILVRVKKTYRT
jgi:hypothetical protein